MAAFGVYPFSGSLWDALVEECQVTTDRSIILEILVQPLLEIRDDFKSGMNPFICRERYRSWLKLAHDTTGPCDFPDWETLASMDTEVWIFEFFEVFESAENYQWEIFFDENVSFNAALKRVPVEHSAEDFVLCLKDMSPPDSLIVLGAPHFGTFYVISSERVDYRGPAEWKSYMAYHVLDDIADGDAEGDIPTFLLPDYIIRAWKKIEERAEPFSEVG